MITVLALLKACVLYFSTKIIIQTRYQRDILRHMPNLLSPLYSLFNALQCDI